MFAQRSSWFTLVIAAALAILPEVVAGSWHATARAEHGAGGRSGSSSSRTITLGRGGAGGHGGERDVVRSQTSVGMDGIETRLLTKLHEINQQEIELGNLAKEKAATPSVRNYGQHLAKDHAQADRKVSTLAQSLNVNLDQPTAATSDDQRKKQADQETAQNLRSAAGAAFDRSFLAAMVSGHEDAINLVTASRDDITNPKLRALTNQLLPQLKGHRNHARSLLSALDKKAERRSENSGPDT